MSGLAVLIDPLFRRVLVILAVGLLIVFCFVATWVASALLRRRTRREMPEDPERDGQHTWRVAAFIAVLPIYYALSFAPVFHLVLRLENKTLENAFKIAYSPIFILCHYSETADDLKDRQMFWWARILYPNGHYF